MVQPRHIAPALALLGCQTPPVADMPWAPQAPAGLGPAVARVGEVAIFAAEVRDQALASGKPPRAALDEIVAFHLLAEALRGSGWPARRDSTDRAHKEILVERLLERDFEGATAERDVPRSELRALYDRAIHAFVHPRMVEVAVLNIPTYHLKDPTAREKARDTVRALKAYVDRHPHRTPEDFADVAKQWQPRGVELYRFWQGTDRPYSEVFGAEVQKLKQPGDTTGIIDEVSGMAIALYISEKPPKHLGFEQVEKELLRGYYPRWRQQKFVEFTRKLERGHRIDRHPERMLARAKPPGA